MPGGGEAGPAARPAPSAPPHPPRPCLPVQAESLCLLKEINSAVHFFPEESHVIKDSCGGQEGERPWTDSPEAWVSVGTSPMPPQLSQGDTTLSLRGRLKLKEARGRKDQEQK